MPYSAFLQSKAVIDRPTGISDIPTLNPSLFPFQADIVRWALRRGRAAIFADCGLGKTICQLDWAEKVATHLQRPVLILAPLAVAQQTANEGARFNIPVTICREQSDVADGVNITNYEKMEHFDFSAFGGLVLDESSILKSYSGKIRTAIIEASQSIPFRLACTATPAPNDHMELGNHAEFLGVLKRTEMLSTFFVHDGGDTSQWRLKGHAKHKFWEWVASWAVCLRRPSDLGYEDGDFILPPLQWHQHVVDSGTLPGLLFAMEARTLEERRAARVASLSDRVSVAASLANNSDDSWLIWCDLNKEGDALTAAIPGAVQVAGSDSSEHKERALLDFAGGRLRVLVTKPSIAGFGMNFQGCHKVAFVGLSDSFEALYQAIRRCWRFGQKCPVDAHVITSTAEGAVKRNIERKEKQADELMQGMVKNMKTTMTMNIEAAAKKVVEYKTGEYQEDGWRCILGDCVEAVSEIPSDSIHYSIFSPPFASLYTYSASDRDMGNCRGETEFLDHFTFLVKQLFRVMMPGRLLSFHCMNLPTTIQHCGVIGISDFRGNLIRMFQEAGFIYHSEVCIWKDPVTAMQRTKALGLLHKQLKKDSCMSRQGIPDYLVTMRKPGENPERVEHTNESFPVKVWQRYASPVWMDINPSDTLQKESAREHADERHICPLQLEVIQRGLELWTNPGDLVLSPFMGIGSEGYVSVKMGRRFLGIELKESYYRQAVNNLKAASQCKAQLSLFQEV